MSHPDEQDVGTRMLGEGAWRMWALEVPSPPYAQPFYEPGSRWYANEYRTDEAPPVPILVTEAEDGPYYGWIAAGDDTPCMIHGEAGLFRMCFAYGPAIEEEHGKGRIVRLNIERMEDDE